MPPENANDRIPPWRQGADRQGASFGSWLRRQREMREVPLREIADVTKISLRYLEALEQDRFDVLPAPVFAKGFLREYARYVGLDSDEVVNSFLTATEARAEAEETEDAAAKPVGATGYKLHWMAWATLAVILLVIAAVVYVSVARARKPGPRQMSSLAAPLPPSAVTETGVEVDPAVEAALTVILDFTDDCWVEALVDGRRRVSELHVQGESMRLEADSRVVLTLGNPAAVRLEVNGSAYPFDFAPDRVARDLEIDLALAAELEKRDP